MLYQMFSRIRAYAIAHATHTALLMGILHLSLWQIVGTLVLHMGCQGEIAYITDMDELAFGLFLGGVFVPILWWYYLALPKIWKDTVQSIYKAGIVGKEVFSILNVPSYTLLVWMVTGLIGLLYRFNGIQSEVSLGRISFWFVNRWTILTITIIVIIHTYALVSFILKALLLAWRMWKFFTQYGIQRVRIFHADGSGGMGVVGDLAMKIAGFAVLVGMWAVWFSALPWFRTGKFNFGLSVILLYAAYVILTPLILVSILWPAHRAMQKYKYSYENKLADELEQTLRFIFEKQNIDTYLERYHALLTVYQAAQDIPTWPISRRRFAKFTSIASIPGVFGIISSIHDVVDISSIFLH